ncbi:MAG: hypothetical protein J6S67_01565 [Methanobrevibacter sp.]|nr:hypothetical protein [Methanobrevibacter sp.]
MYIQPNTTIKIIKNCPLDIDYANTIYFTSVTAQTTFFITTLDGYTLQNNSYQRVEKGKMRIAMNAESLYNCNYLAFQNASFGSKWFYAFITRVDYINNVTSEISYEIDIMQTWHFNYVMMDCFVEREHSVTDNIGDNLVDEKLDTGEYITSDYSRPTDLEDMAIVLFCTVDLNYDDVDGYVSQGVFSGLYPVTFVDNQTQTAEEQLIEWVSHLPILKQNAIVSGCMMPYKLVHRPVSPSSFQHVVERKTTLMRSDGTAVKNKKCLTYPYNFLYATNLQGKSAIYRYEFFGKHIIDNVDSIIFRINGGCNPNPSVFIFPYDYKGGNGLLENREEGLYLGGYPQIGWNIDAYKAWLAQNATSIGINGMAAGIGAESYQIANMQTKAAVASGATAIGAMAGTEMMAIAGMAIPAVALASLAVAGTVHMMMPPQAKGNPSGAAQYQANNMNFEFMNKHITPEFATIIDDYFSMYGYATNKVKRPNRNARPEWNYVKTIGCKIDPDLTAGLPADDAKAIEDVYNKGITFWNNPAHIGDYSYNNSPTI